MAVIRSKDIAPERAALFRFLNSWKDAEREQNRSTAHLAVLRAAAERVTTAYGGISARSGRDHGREDILIDIADETTRLEELEQAARAAKADVEALIALLPDSIQREIIRSHFIDGMKMREIMDRMAEGGEPVSERQFYRIYSRALDAAQAYFNRYTARGAITLTRSV